MHAKDKSLYSFSFIHISNDKNAIRVAPKNPIFTEAGMFRSVTNQETATLTVRSLF